MTITLDQFATDVSFNIDYYGGTGASPAVKLHVDTIVAKRQGDLSLPVIAGVFMEPTEIPLQRRLSITDEFERRGGLVLTPDELMATLNPAYMIEWATPIRDSDHPALAEARALLQQDKFFESLSTVRTALRDQVGLLSASQKVVD
ncbi:MAG: hypothetical protein MUQ10_19460 [Anaerolineae bacterium]|nr:hypothetical protein [Anaerolineae bacterium]